MKEDKDRVEGMRLLLKKLQSEVARRSASKAQRLLDDILRLVTPQPGVHPEEQQEVSLISVA